MLAGAAVTTDTERPGFFRRNWRRILLGLVTLLALAAITLYVLFERNRRGPPLPQCAAPALRRKTFDAPLQVTGPKSPGHYNNEPTAALLPSGAIALAYQAHNGMFDENGLGVATVGLDRKVDERPLKSDRKRHFDEWMSADAAGTLHLVWLGHDGGMPDKRVQVGYAESRDGLTWTAPVAVNDVATDCPGEEPGCMDKPMIASVKDASVVFYFSEPGDGLKAVRVTDGGRAVGPSVAAGDGAYGNVTVAPSGTIHLVYVAWSERDVDRYGDRRIHVELTKSDDGGKSFAPAVRVSAEEEPIPFFFSNPDVAVDEQRGFLYVVYPTGARDAAWDLTLATSKDGGRTWTRSRVNDDAHCANHMTPKVALDPRTGTLHVVWLENRSGHGGLAYAACAPGGACSPNEAVSDAPFASYTFARHRGDWLGEYGSLVIDAERGLLHAIWSQPVDEKGEAVSRIFYARATLPR